MSSLYKNSLEVGFSSEKISTKRKIELGGYGYYLNRVVTGILDDIYTKALYLSTKKSSILLISNDLIGFPLAFTRSIAQKISRKIHIPEENILISCTHTHSAPATANLEGCGEIDKKYLQGLKTKIIRNALEALKDPQPAKVKLKKFRIESFSFNRAFPKRTRRNQDVLFLLFETNRRKILLTQFSTHPSILNNKSTVISKDFVNAFYQILKENGCSDLIYFSGACEEILPSIIRKHVSTNSTSDAYVTKAQFKNEVRLLKKKLINQSAKCDWEEVGIDTIKVVTKDITLNFDIPSYYKDQSRMKKHFEDIFYDKIDVEKGLIKAGPEKKDPKVISKKKRAKGVQSVISMRFNQFQQQLKANKLESSRKVRLTVIQIGEILIVSLPFEVTNKFELNLRTLYPKLLVFCCTNGLEGYIYSPDETASYPRTRGSLLYNLFPFERLGYNKLFNASKRIINFK